MRKQKGITLIALVITIIVLLILAGVSIAMLSGENGLLTNSREDQTTMIPKTNEEIVKLALQDLLVEYHEGDAIATNITNTNHTLNTLDINKDALKEAIYKNTSEANIRDVVDETLNIAEDNLEEEILVLKVDFEEGQDIYVLPSTGKIVTKQIENNR